MIGPKVKLKVLVACEFSGTVRDAFALYGHDAWSCDLDPTAKPGQHIQGDVRDILNDGWDLMIAHPPCTYLAVSGARWWKGKEQEQEDAIAFVRTLLRAPIKHIAIENPVGKLSTAIRPPTQYIHPYQYGGVEVKKTGLWLKNLPRLKSTEISNLRIPLVHHTGPSATRGKDRSITWWGIANAMAIQWGNYVSSLKEQQILQHEDVPRQASELVLV
jgi:hypothetical protein